jgi:hypothetical protein
MSTRNRVEYCPICKQNVLLVREALNWALVIILIIFTGGIGLIVYVIIYFNKPASRCIHCHSQIALTPTSSVQTSNQVQIDTRLEQRRDGDSAENIKPQLQKFCSFCGEALSNREAKFCAHCGIKV